MLFRSSPTFCERSSQPVHTRLIRHPRGTVNAITARAPASGSWRTSKHLLRTKVDVSWTCDTQSCFGKMSVQCKSLAGSRAGYWCLLIAVLVQAFDPDGSTAETNPPKQPGRDPKPDPYKQYGKAKENVPAGVPGPTAVVFTKDQLSHPPLWKSEYLDQTGDPIVCFRATHPTAVVRRPKTEERSMAVQLSQIQGTVMDDPWKADITQQRRLSQDSMEEGAPPPALRTPVKTPDSVENRGQQTADSHRNCKRCIRYVSVVVRLLHGS